MLSREQAQALTRLVHLLRPAWNEEGIFAVLGQCRDEDAFEVALAALRAAADKKAQTPGVIPTRGPHWNDPPPKEPEKPTWRPPTRAEACADCGRTESQHGDYAWHRFVPMDRAAEGRAPEGAALARAELAQTRANTCPCGVDPRGCAEHHPDKPERVKPATEQETEERLMEVAE